MGANNCPFDGGHVAGLVDLLCGCRDRLCEVNVDSPLVNVDNLDPGGKELLSTERTNNNSRSCGLNVVVNDPGDPGSGGSGVGNNEFGGNDENFDFVGTMILANPGTVDIVSCGELGNFGDSPYEEESLAFLNPTSFFAAATAALTSPSPSNIFDHELFDHELVSSFLA